MRRVAILALGAFALSFSTLQSSVRRCGALVKMSRM